MLAAVRSRAGWLTIVALPVLAGCSSVPGLPGFGPSAPSVDLIQKAEPGNSDRPAFFVQWKQSGLPGLTKRPAIDKSTALPEYPAAAVRKEDEGVASVETCVTVDGRLVDTHIAKSSGSKTLDDATLAWAKTAKYTPAEFNGEPFAVCGYRFDYEWRVQTEQR